jgi:NADH-quinone oxidoreductase subunit A
MLAEYAGILLILAVGTVLAGSLLVVHLLLGPSRSFDSKLEPFECGESQLVSPRRRYAVKYYLVGILFVVFDVEAVFFYPWGAVFVDLGWFGFAQIFTFTVPLVVGLVYVWMKGGLEW